MEMQIREYQKQDFQPLKEIIRSTWHYDEFSSPETASRLAEVFLRSCLTNYTFSQVAVLDGTAAGIILVKNNKDHRCALSARFQQILSIVKLYASKEGRQSLKSSKTSMRSMSNCCAAAKRPIRRNWLCLLSVHPVRERASAKSCFIPRLPI